MKNLRIKSKFLKKILNSVPRALVKKTKYSKNTFNQYL
jgi:hypothetical protein